MVLYIPKEPSDHRVNFWLFWLEEFCSVFTRHAGLDVKFSCWQKCNWNQRAFTKGIHFSKSASSSKKQFAEKFLISSPDKLVDLISGSISQQRLRLSSLQLFWSPTLLHSTYTLKSQMCECSPAEMFIPILACRSESKLSSETFELCCKLHLHFWELINMDHDV